MLHEGEKRTRDAGWLGRKVASGSLVAMAANFVYLVTRLVMAPFILAYVSLADFGLWSVCFVILSYAGLTAFGVNNAYVKYVAEYHADGQTERISMLLSTGLASMTALSAILFAAIWWLVPLLLAHFDIAPELRELAGFMIVWTSAAFLLDLAFGCFRGVLEGLQEVALAKLIWLVTTLAETALVFALLPLGHGIRGVMYAYVIKTLVDVALNLVFALRSLPGLQIRPGRVSRQALPELFVFGGKIQVLGLLGIFLGTLDRIVAASFAGLAATGLYEIGRKFPLTARSVTGSALSSLLPAASYLGGEWRESPWPSLNEKVGKYGGLALASLAVSAACLAPWWFREWLAGGGDAHAWRIYGAAGAMAFLLWPGIGALRRLARFMRPGGEYLAEGELKALYLRSSRYMNLINVVFYAFIIASAPRLIFAWVGPGYEGAPLICAVLGVMHCIHMATGPASSLFRGINRSGRELEAVVVHLVLAVVWTPLLGMSHGLAGVVAATVGSTILGSFYFVARTNTAFRVTTRQYLRDAVLPVAGPAAAGALVWLGYAAMPWLGRWETLFAVLGGGLAYLGLCGVFLKLWGLRPEEWDAMVRPVLSRLGGRRHG